MSLTSYATAPQQLLPPDNTNTAAAAPAAAALRTPNAASDALQRVLQFVDSYRIRGPATTAGSTRLRRATASVKLLLCTAPASLTTPRHTDGAAAPPIDSEAPSSSPAAADPPSSALPMKCVRPGPSARALEHVSVLPSTVGDSGEGEWSSLPTKTACITETLLAGAMSSVPGSTQYKIRGAANVALRPRKVPKPEKLFASGSRRCSEARNSSCKQAAQPPKGSRWICMQPRGR